MELKSLEMKPRLFIGSSSEGLKTAKFLQKQLAEITECEIWNEGVFGLNESYFETLIKIPNLYDFALLIATKDDRTKSRNKLFNAPRDNIIFEFGLFLGKLHRKRVYILQEEEVKLPSDLLGITVLKFRRNSNDNRPSASLKKSTEKLLLIIKEEGDRFIYTVLPSTALAQGYFNNFILPVSKNLVTEKSVWLKNDSNEIILDQEWKKEKKLKEWKKFELIIIVPDDLFIDYQDRIREFITEHHLVKLEVASNTRDYNFYLNADQDSKEILKLYDIPTTLSGIDNAIDRLIPKDYEGKEKKLETLLKKREISNFVKTLDFLINDKKATKDKVRIEIVDI